MSASGRGADRDRSLDRVRRVSDLLDDAVRVPGTNRRVGLDPVIGLLPGVGDAASFFASWYVVIEAARLGVPRATLARMAVNVGVDALVGSVPLVGDLFDAAWKANVRNVALLEARVDDPGGAGRDRRVLVGVALALLLAVGAVVVAVVALVVWLVAQVGGL